MSINTVGIIGVGNMDLPMLKALRRAGFSVVARDLRREAEAAARDAGARIASSARDLAAISDMILVVVVVDAAQIEDALFREPRPAAAWRPEPWSPCAAPSARTMPNALPRALWRRVPRCWRWEKASDLIRNSCWRWSVPVRDKAGLSMSACRALLRMISPREPMPASC